MVCNEPLSKTFDFICCTLKYNNFGWQSNEGEEVSIVADMKGQSLVSLFLIRHITAHHCLLPPVCEGKSNVRGSYAWSRNIYIILEVFSLLLSPPHTLLPPTHLTAAVCAGTGHGKESVGGLGQDHIPEMIILYLFAYMEQMCIIYISCKKFQPRL